jgi:hypothetical protein
MISVTSKQSNRLYLEHSDDTISNYHLYNYAKTTCLHGNRRKVPFGTICRGDYDYLYLCLNSRTDETDFDNLYMNVTQSESRKF